MNFDHIKRHYYGTHEDLNPVGMVPVGPDQDLTAPSPSGLPGAPGPRTHRRGARPMTVLGAATLGGGCFWCLEAVYEQMRGVVSVESGYSGGRTADPSYESVCSGTTGHAEVVQVRFDPAVASYPQVLEVFFGIHDPTTKDRQGNDIGTQYRSIIFAHDEDQAATARMHIADLEAEGVFAGPIVTEVQLLERFWPAEDYHRQYYRRNPAQPYCMMVVGPKVAKYRERFGRLLRDPGELSPGG